LSVRCRVLVHNLKRDPFWLVLGRLDSGVFDRSNHIFRRDHNAYNFILVLEVPQISVRRSWIFFLRVFVAMPLSWICKPNIFLRLPSIPSFEAAFDDLIV
jgi:hypothetical protein